MTRILTAMSCVLLPPVFCGAFALTHAPKIGLAFKEGNATQPAAKARYSRSSRSFNHSDSDFR